MPVSGRPERPMGGSSGRVRVGVDLDQEELELRRDHRLPAAVISSSCEDALQHIARGDLDRAAVLVETVDGSPGPSARRTTARC